MKDSTQLQQQPSVASWASVWVTPLCLSMINQLVLPLQSQYYVSLLSWE